MLISVNYKPLVYYIEINWTKVSKFNADQIQSYYSMFGSLFLEEFLKDFCKRKFLLLVKDYLDSNHDNSDLLFEEYDAIISFLRVHANSSFTDIEDNVNIKKIMYKTNYPYFVLELKHLLSHLQKFNLVKVENGKYSLTEIGLKHCIKSIKPQNRKQVQNNKCSNCGRILDINNLCEYCTPNYDNKRTIDITQFEKSNRF